MIYTFVCYTGATDFGYDTKLSFTLVQKLTFVTILKITFTEKKGHSQGKLPEAPIKSTVKSKPPVRNQLSDEKRKEIIQLSSELVNGKK